MSGTSGTATAENAMRRNFGFDAVGALGTGMFNALVVNFLSVIARREGADPLLLAAVAAAPFAANTLSIFSGFWVPGEKGRVRYVSGLLFLGAVCSCSRWPARRPSRWWR